MGSPVLPWAVREFRCCLRYWLGVPLDSHQYPDKNVVASLMLKGCGGNGDHISRHNAIQDVIFSAAQCASLVPSKEMPNLFPNSLARPADIFLPNWSCGHPAALDVHVISFLQQQTFEEVASNAGHALQVGVKLKLYFHLSACQSVGIDFIPLVADTLGGLAEHTMFIICSIGVKPLDRQLPFLTLPTVPDTSLFVSPFSSGMTVPVMIAPLSNSSPSFDGLV